MVRWVRWGAIVWTMLLLIATMLAWDHLRTLHSLRRVPGTNAYVMDYYCDYHMDEIRQRGLDVDRLEDSVIETFFPDPLAGLFSQFKRLFVPQPVQRLGAPGDYCSTVALQARDGNVYFGRNFDWPHDALLVLRMHDDDGLASIAVLDLAYLNLNRRDLDETNLLERLPLLFAPYYLMDGMNRHGVAVSVMAVSAQPPRDPGKPAILDSTLMRLMLDYAHNVDEAIELARSYNWHFVDTTGHLMIADATGKSCILECIGGQLRVVPKSGTWQVCTNHLAWNRTEEQRDQLCSRYRTGSQLAEQAGQSVDSDGALRVTRSMVQEGFTMWTSLYNLTTGDVRVLYKSRPKLEYTDTLPRATE